MCSSVLPKHTKCFKAAELDQPHSSQYMHHPVHTNDSDSQRQGELPTLNYCPEKLADKCRETTVPQRGITESACCNPTYYFSL